MTLNIFFLTITIAKRESSLEQALHNEQANKIFEDNRRKVDKHNGFYDKINLNNLEIAVVKEQIAELKSKSNTEKQKLHFKDYNLVEAIV